MKYLTVNTHKLNLRDKPNLNTSTIVAVMNKGEHLKLLGFKNNFRWVKVERPNGTIGYCSYKYCLGVPNPNDIRSYDYKWLKIAFAELHTAELRGPEDNNRILTYLRTCESLPDDMKNSDETAWCSAFMNWCVEHAGYAGTDSAWALSWKNWGQPALKRRGRIAVFERYVRQNGVTKTFGHVGFYLGMVDGKILLLGGNQKDSVSVQLYPEDNQHYKFLGCRKA